MSRISPAGLTAGTALALSLAVAATPAFGAGHPLQKTHLTHTHLTLHATQEKVTKNDKFKATVVATLRAHKKPLAGENVELFQRVKGATKWVDTSTGSATDDNGKATFTFVQSQTKEQYRVVFAGDSSYQRSHSGAITIKKSKATKSS